MEERPRVNRPTPPFHRSEVRHLLQRRESLETGCRGVVEVFREDITDNEGRDGRGFSVEEERVP
jgi:hypothetical protein